MAEINSTSSTIDTTNMLPRTSANIMVELWNKAAPSLNRESLEWFSGATELAECTATSLAELAMGIGGLASCDDERSGSFQSSSSLAELMFAISNAIDNIGGLIRVGSEASHRLHNQDFYREAEQHGKPTGV